jgi:hypothetical protein
MHELDMLSGPQKKFCDAFAVSMNAADAYRAAYPRASGASAESAASRLLKNVQVKSEVDRIRAAADEKAGSAVLTLIEKRIFLARVVRAPVANLPEDSDLWNSVKHTAEGTEFRLPDKLRAIALDDDLAGAGSQAGATDAIAELLERVRI